MISAVATIAHWDEVEAKRHDVGHIGASWADLGSAAGSVTTGVKRIRIDPGKWSTPAHVELAEEEIFYVLGGSGLSWQDGATYEVGEGDCLVHLVEAEAHSLRAGPEGLDVLAFGMRVPAGGTLLRRAGVIWHWPGWAEAPGGKHPYEREADVGEPELPAEPSERPARIAATRDVPQMERTSGGDVLRLARDLARAAGSVRTGLQHVTVPAGKLSCPPHCHSAEEEIFVVLAGDGHLLLWEGDGVVEHPVEEGTVACRPPGTGVAHAFRAGAGGLTLLLYGTRDPRDVCFYPRSGKVFFRGLGLVTRLGELLDYWEGED
jgi:uncharacterized cupin superfamily protein